MTDKQLKRNLRSIGKTCFVTYFCKFANSALSNDDIVEQMKKNENYTKKACQSRTSHARSIIKAGRSRDALINICESHVPDKVRNRARQLLEKV